jgi:hypothetical protein
VVLRNYIQGLVISNDGTTPTTVIDVAAGQCADSTQVNLMSLAAIKKSISSTWVVGSGNGGLDTGTVAASTWYFVHVITRVDTGVVDVLISKSATAPTLPTSYTLFRRIGAILTNASSNIIAFTQYPGGVFMWNTPVTNLNTSSPTTGAPTLLAMSIPLGVVVQALCHVEVTSAGGTGTIALEPPPSGAYGLLMFFGTTGGCGNGAVWSNTSSQIAYFITATCAVQIAVDGWIDPRGRDS